MRPIHLAHLDKTRPVLVLTRERARGALVRVTVAPITSTIRGVSTEVVVGARNGLDHDCVISCDNIRTVASARLGRMVGLLFEDQEADLTRAIVNAFDLRVEDFPAS